MEALGIDVQFGSIDVSFAHNISSNRMASIVVSGVSLM